MRIIYSLSNFKQSIGIQAAPKFTGVSPNTNSRVAGILPDVEYADNDDDNDELDKLIS